MRISHHWLLPAAVLVGSVAPATVSLITNDASVFCAGASAGGQGPACALARRMIVLPA